MEYRNLGKSGLKVSELSFGSWVTFNKQVDTNLAEKMFGTCLDAGINFFDNAEGYERGESEIVMGKALKALDKPRDSLCFSSSASRISCLDITLEASISSPARYFSLILSSFAISNCLSVNLFIALEGNSIWLI